MKNSIHMPICHEIAVSKYIALLPFHYSFSKVNCHYIEG
jgi:hypothetical protein